MGAEDASRSVNADDRELQYPIGAGGQQTHCPIRRRRQRISGVVSHPACDEDHEGQAKQQM
jgi:hypothetical protein